MEVYEKINFYLKSKKLSKKEFAKRLIALEPKLKNTNEIPSQNTIYAYLNGRIGIKVELIPYIAEILDIPEQILFDDTLRARKRFIKHILETISNEEKDILKTKVCDEKGAKSIPLDKFYKIQDLLIYAPQIFLDKLETTLREYKELTLKFN